MWRELRVSWIAIGQVRQETPRAELEVKDSFQGGSKNVISSNLPGDLAIENLIGASLDQTTTGALKKFSHQKVSRMKIRYIPTTSSKFLYLQQYFRWASFFDRQAVILMLPTQMRKMYISMFFTLCIIKLSHNEHF